MDRAEATAIRRGFELYSVLQNSDPLKYFLIFSATV